MVNALTPQDKDCIQTYIRTKKIKAVEKIDITKGKVNYSDKIKSTKNIEELKDEELVRAYLLTRLSNELGYPVELMEMEHIYSAGRPHTNTSMIDMIRKFKKAFGLTPHQFQIQCKVRKAQKLLETTKSIPEVAYEAGFCDQSHLDRCFQKIVGMTPRQYQDALANDD